MKHRALVAVSFAATLAWDTSAQTLPTISGATIAEEPSPLPSAAEWQGANAVRANRGDKTTCTISLLREWLRLQCPGVAGGGLVAGDPKGVSVRVSNRTFPDKPDAVSTELVLPLRRGAASIVSFLQTSSDYDGSLSFKEAGILSVVWRSGASDPVLVLNALPDKPP